MVFPGSSLVVQWLELRAFSAMAQIQSLVRELRSCKPCSAAKKKKWYVHTMKYYSAIKCNEVLIHAMIGVNLESMLSKRSQTQKAPYFMIPYIWNTQNRQIHGDKGWICDFHGLGEGIIWRACLVGMGFPFGMMKKFLN